MKFSIHELSEIEFIDFHTHEQKVAPKTLSVISVEFTELKNLSLKNLNHRFFSAGMHPWLLPANTKSLKKDLQALREILLRSRVIALGEIGLDRLRGPAPGVQKAYFTEALKLAKELNKPLIIHCVRCYPELLSIKKQFAPDLNMLIHGYNGNIETLKQLLKHDCYVSLGAAALKREDVCRYVRQKPDYLHQICLETDDSGINISDIFIRAAKVFETDIQKLTRIMKINFISLFQESKNV